MNSLLKVVLLSLLSGFLITSHGFGKNKVQYQNLSWRYIETPHFNIYKHNNTGNLPEISARWIEADYSILQREMQFTHQQEIPLVVYGSPALFSQTNIITDLIPEEVGGFTEMFKKRVVVPFNGNYVEYRHVLHHELVHAFQYGMLFDQFGGSLFRGGNVDLPLWFAEGSAEFLSSGWDNEADMYLMDRAVNGEIELPGYGLDGYMAYKGGQSFFHYLQATRGNAPITRLFKTFRETKSVKSAFAIAYNASPENLGEEWIRAVRRNYWPELGRRDEPAAICSSVTNHTKQKTVFNLKPRLSPDGKLVAFFTDKTDYTSIEITDREGTPVSSIQQNGYSGFFESFQPFRSGLCWSPDGSRLAFVTSSAGKDEIRIVDVRKKKLITTLHPPTVSVFSPDWSSDGDKIVFCGIVEDRSDLFVYSFKTNLFERLTSSIAYESSPRFVPGADGLQIIFACQDTSGTPTMLGTGSTVPASHIYSIDLATRAIVQLTHSSSNETSPCASPDGKSIVFISDRNGIRNIYAASISQPDSAFPVTDYIGGCSDLDWPIRDSTIVFSLFARQGWDVLLLPQPLAHVKNSQLVPTRWAQSCADTSLRFFQKTSLFKSDLSPEYDRFRDSLDRSVPAKKTITDSATSKVLSTKDTTNWSREETIGISSNSAASIDDTVGAAKSTPDTFVPPPPVRKDSSNYTASYPYKLQFSPDYVNFGVALSTYGYTAGQGIIVVSDILGNHQISLAGDLQASYDGSSHIYASYLNRTYRVNFGISFFYSRDMLGMSSAGYPQFIDLNTGGTALVRYAFSKSTRLDFSLYYLNDRRTPIVIDNSILTPSETNATTFSAMLPSLSAVYDDILWGVTGPVNGLRGQAGIIVSPPSVASGESFIAGDIDIRKYFHFEKKFVIALRATVGASQSLENGGVSPRRYFLGGNDNWINLDINEEQYLKNANNTFYSEFVVPFRGWDYFDLTGTRYAVLNSEFRFPFIREFSLAWPLPLSIRYITGVAFADAGNAWDPADEYANIPLPNSIYGGVGFGMRVNLGIFVLRYDLAWKTDWQTYLANDPKNYFSLGADF